MSPISILLLAKNTGLEQKNPIDAMNSASKNNFDSVFASTEWSIVFDQTRGKVWYYRRENFENAYSFTVGQ